MKSIFSLIVVAFALSHVSCDDKARYVSQINSLDSTRIELDKQLAVFQSIDTNKINRYLMTYQSNVEWIQKNIKDTLSVDYLNALKNYRGINEPLVFFQQNYLGMVEDAKVSKIQLQKLAADMKNASIEEERAFEYYTIEKNEAMRIMEALIENHQLAKQSVDTFDKYNNEIEKLITLYKNGNAAK